MAPVRASRTPKVFIDSSVLIAAAISPKGAARELIVRAFRNESELCLSDLVLEETERNLSRKAPSALPVFRLLMDYLPAEMVIPPKALVIRVGKIVNEKDAPIVAAAGRAGADYLATFDRGLLRQREEIRTTYGPTVATPADVLSGD